MKTIFGWSIASVIKNLIILLICILFMNIVLNVKLEDYNNLTMFEYITKIANGEIANPTGVFKDYTVEVAKSFVNGFKAVEIVLIVIYGFNVLLNVIAVITLKKTYSKGLAIIFGIIKIIMASYISGIVYIVKSGSLKKEYKN